MVPPWQRHVNINLGLRPTSPHGGLVSALKQENKINRQLVASFSCAAAERDLEAAGDLSTSLAAACGRGMATCACWAQEVQGWGAAAEGVGAAVTAEGEGAAAAEGVGAAVAAEDAGAAMAAEDAGAAVAAEG